MADEHSQKYCSDCQSNVLAIKKGTNHILHLLLTVVTGGLWLIVWLFVPSGGGPWRCTRCGSADLANSKQAHDDDPWGKVKECQACGANNEGQSIDMGTCVNCGEDL